jgi:hypothetical protein
MSLFVEGAENMKFNWEKLLMVEYGSIDQQTSTKGTAFIYDL